MICCVDCKVTVVPVIFFPLTFKFPDNVGFVSFETKFVVQDNIPFPSVVKNCPDDPKVTGHCE